MINFEKLFIDYKIPYSTRVNKGWINSNCIYCDTKENSFNLGFNPDGYCNCWKCGSHDLNKTLSLILHINVNQIKDVLDSYKGVYNQIPHKAKNHSYKQLSLPTDTFTILERNYLKSRGFDCEYLNKKYGVVGGGIIGKYKFRIVIPIYYKNDLVSFVSRSILDKDKLKEYNLPRYLNLSNEESLVNIKDIFYNLDNCNSDTVILTEGCFDVIRLGDINSNSDNVMCSLGTQITQSQLRLLSERFKKVYIMFDNEEEAQRKARKYAMQISSLGLDVEVVDAYSDYGVNDGAELNQNQVYEIRKELGV